MPYNGLGSFTRVYSWTADAAAGIPIESSRMDTDSNDMATNGFNNCITRDGQGQPTANLPMANFKHTGAAVSTTAGDYVTYEQITTGGAALALHGTSLTLTGTLVKLGDSTNVTATGTTTGFGLWGRAATTTGGGVVLRGNTGGSGGTFSDGVEIYTGGASTRRAAFDSSGNLYVGAFTNPTAGLVYFKGGTTLTVDSTNGVNVEVLQAGVTVGSITNSAGTTAYNTTSDQRLKIDDGRISQMDAGEIIDKLAPRWFRWKNTPDEQSQPGFFAQQVAKVFPWAVKRGGRGGIWQMDAAKLLPIVITELQALRRRVAELEKHL